MSEPNFGSQNKVELTEALTGKPNLKHKTKPRPPAKKPSSPVSEIIETQIALERIWCVSSNIDTWLLELPIIKKRTECFNKITQAKMLLSQVFLEVGAM